MNTKTTKFLAVLAVFAMAFAVFAVADDNQSEATSNATTSNIFTNEEGTTAVGTIDADVSAATTWYIKDGATITGDFAVTSTGSLTIKLVTGVDAAALTITGNATLGGATTISKNVTVKIDTGMTLTVSSTLTINGTLENNSATTATTGGTTTGLVINGSNAIVTGNGTICGTSPRLVKINAGTLENVTVSQKDWAAGNGTVAADGNNQAIIYVSPSADANVKIENITILMKDTGKRTDNTTYGTHGIGVYGTNKAAVTINKVTFSAIGSGTVEEEFLIIDSNTNTDTTVTITEITRDSDVRVKDGYGEFTVVGVTTLGDKVTIDSSIKSLRVAGENTVAKAFAVDNIIFKSDSVNKLTVSEDLTVNGNIINGTSKASTIDIAAGKKVINTGTTRVEGNISTTSTGLFENKGTLVMDKGATILNLDNTKTVRLYEGVIGSKTGATSSLINDGTIYVMSEKATIQVTTQSGSGTIDTSAVAKEVFIHGDISTKGTEFTKNQIVTFDGDTTLLKGASMIFKGTAIIPAGVTVTIEDGAQIIFDGSADNLGKLINDGRLIIEGAVAQAINETYGTAGLFVYKAQVENNGTLELAYDGEIDEGTTKELANITVQSMFKNNGNITIGEKSKLTTATASLVNSATGVITIFGDLKGASSKDLGILNAGSITLSSEVNSEIYILNNAVDAEVNIMMTYNKVTVDDSSFVKEGKFKNGGNVIVLLPANNTTCGGITITSATFPVTVIEDKKPVIYTHTALRVEGALIVDKTAITEGADYKATLTFTSNADGSIAVIDELTLTDTKLSTVQTNNVLTNFYVSGTLTVTSSSSFNNDGELTVDGVLYMVKNSITTTASTTGIINAAKYEIAQTVLTDKITVYTNVPDAIEGAAEHSVETVTVTGTVDIDESIMIPAGMKVKVSNSGTQVLTVSKDVVVEVYSDETGFAILDTTGKIQVNGKLIFDDVKKSKKGTGEINSEVIVESGNTVVYTTLAWAIADAGSEEATLTLCGDTTITTNTTIPENITVDTNGKKFTVKNAELTIDGELFLKSGTTYTVDGDKAKIIVNGAITSESQMTYDGKAYPAGLYLTVGDKKTYVIGNIDDAEAWALVADDDKLTYWGDLKTIGISFDAEAILTFEGNVTAVSMSVGSKAVVNFNGNVEIATVTMGAATINFAAGKDIDGLFTSPVGSILFNEAKADKASSIAVAVKDTVTTMTLTGSIVFSEEIDYEYQVATVGDVIIKADLFELTVGTGTTTVANNVTIALLEVYGDLVIDNTYKMTTTAAMVYGSITANAATDTKAKATAEIKYLSAGVDYKKHITTSAAASIEGDVTVDYAVISADATVPSTIENMPYATDVYIEGELFLTVYGISSENIDWIKDYVEFDISDPSAKFEKWVDEDGEDVTNPKIGAPTEIYAVYDYNVYSVKIITDAGIKSVAINGVELENGSGNVFYVPSKLTAGTYKVTYTLKNGYSGEAVLSTSTGTILKDNSFVISPGSEKALTFQLAGTEPTPEPEPVTPEEKSEWTITTILLVILVILIAIMAVIVALRLNRS